MNNITYNGDGTVTLSEGYFNDLRDDARWLSCLEDAGVDNWGGCDYAREMYQEQYGQEDE